MAKRGDGYGSEDHFLRYRAERPEVFDRLLLDALGAPDATLEWVYPTGAAGEKKPQGLGLLRNGPDIMKAWKSFWPAIGRHQTHGVAKLHRGEPVERVLVERRRTRLSRNATR